MTDVLFSRISEKSTYFLLAIMKDFISRSFDMKKTSRIDTRTVLKTQSADTLLQLRWRSDHDFIRCSNSV